MSSKELRSMEDLSIRNRWDGYDKYFTNECPNCDGYLELSDGEVCVKGVAWKRLNREKIRKTCSLIKRVEKEREKTTAPKVPVLVFTPRWIDFYNGKWDILETMGFKTRLVRKSDAKSEPGFSIDFE